MDRPATEAGAIGAPSLQHAYNYARYSLQLSPMFADPPGSKLLIHFAGSDAQHERNDFGLRSVNLVSVPAKEDVDRKERDPFVAIQKPVMSGKAIEIRGSQIVD